MFRHQYAFFGQKCGILFDSAEQTKPEIYLRFIKKLPGGKWEKPSLKQGKVIKLNLLEIIAILYVLNGTNLKWSTVHRFQGNQTQISFTYNTGKTNISITGYQKQLGIQETVLFRDLLTHVYKEKIEFSTVGTITVPNEIHSKA